MPSFTDVISGVGAFAQDVQQIIDALKGTAGKGVPLSPTAVNDASNFALAVRNNDAGASKALIAYKADGSVLLQVDKNGVVASPDGAVAAGTLVTTASTQTLTNKTVDSSSNTLTVRNAALAADVARANQLVNGGFEVWQRGNGPFTASGAYTADRWSITLGGSSTLSIVKNTANVDVGSLACAACTYVHNAASYLSQTLKLSEGNQLAGRPISCSVRVRTSTAAAVQLQLVTDGTGGGTVNSAVHTGGGTYETLTGTATVPTDATQVQLFVRFGASCTAYLDNAMLVVGSVAADYVPLPPADDLARCLRYYETIGGVSGQLLTVGAGTGATAAEFAFMYSRKAVTPTITQSAAANFFIRQGGGNIAFTTFSAYSTGATATIVSESGAAGLTTNAALLLTAANASATLSAEANP